MVRFIKKAKINSSSDKVWSVFAHEFDDAYRWMASIPHSYGANNGKRFEGAKTAGRVCELTPDHSGMKASEQFLDYDEANKTCTVRIDFVKTPFMFPVDHNRLEFSVVDTNDNECEMTWSFRSQLKPWGYLMWPLLRAGFSKFVGQVMEELVYYVENDEPHPRKQRKLQRAKLASNA